MLRDEDPMILIKNKIRRIAIKTGALKRDVQKLLDILGYSDFDLGILLTTNKTIRKYNKQYRGKDKPTDILSFPFYPDIKPGQRIKAKTEAEKNLGDIIVSLEYVMDDAKRLGVIFKEYLLLVLIHGICHLIGYTHDTDKAYEQMQEKENELLKKLKNNYS